MDTARSDQPTRTRTSTARQPPEADNASTNTVGASVGDEHYVHRDDNHDDNQEDNQEMVDEVDEDDRKTILPVASGDNAEEAEDTADEYAEKKRIDGSDDAKVVPAEAVGKDASRSAVGADSLEVEDGIGKAGLLLLMDAQEEAISSIEPLPASASNHVAASIPGAHAIGGGQLSCLGNDNFTSSTISTSSNFLELLDTIDDEELGGIIGGAFLVEESLAQDIAQEVAAAEVFPQEDLVEAVKLPAESHKNCSSPKKKGYITLCFLLLLLPGMTAIIHALAQSDTAGDTANDDSSSNDVVPSSDNASHHLTHYTPFQDKLRPATVNAINSNSGPYYLANAWMMQDPNLKTYSKKRQLQRFVLAAFYYATHGDNWLRKEGWLDIQVSECDWYSSSANSACSEDHTLRHIELESNNLQGTLPRALFSQRYINDNSSEHFFHGILTLNIANNQISGQVPSLAGAPMLETFAISNNSFTGGLVSRYGGISSLNLRVIKMDYNQIYGDVTKVFQRLPKLEYFDVTSNVFSGELAKEVQHCKNLTFMSVKDNRFMGPIPTEIGLLTQLTDLDLAGNHLLQGAIPSELGMLTNLVRLNMTGTMLSGGIPPESCARIQADTLQISANCSRVGNCSRPACQEN